MPGILLLSITLGWELRIIKEIALIALFRKCKRDNLNSLWSVDELYIKEIKKDEFFYVLEGRLKPIYESARTQGYGIWRAGSNSQL